MILLFFSAHYSFGKDDLYEKAMFCSLASWLWDAAEDFWLNVGSFEQVVQSADTEPTIPVGFEQQEVTAVWIRLAMVAGQEIGEDALLFFGGERESNLSGLAMEVVHTEYGVIAPGVLHYQDIRGACRDKREVAPANLGDLFAHTNNTFHPVEKRVRVPALVCDIDMLKAVRAVADNR